MKIKQLKTIIVACIFILLVLAPSPLFVKETVQAADTDYFVKNGGNDGLDGKSDANAWETLEKVRDEMPLASGDNIYFKYGDNWTITTGSSYINIAGFGGTSGDRAILGAYGTPADGLPRIHNNSFGLISLTGNNHNLTIQYLRFETTTDEGVWLKEGSSSNVTVENCEFKDNMDCGISFYGTTNGIIRNNHMINAGESNDGIFLWYSDYCLVENNTVIAGADNEHSLLLVYASDYIIVRNNTCDGIGYTNLDDCGNILYASGHIVMDDNIFNFSNGAGLKTQGAYSSIIRRNRISNVNGYGLGATINTANSVHNNTWYHNTIYNAGNGSSPSYDGGWRNTVYEDETGHFKDSIIKNNIFQTCVEHCIVNFSGAPEYDQTYNILWDNNNIYDGNTSDIKRRDGSYTVAQAESSFPLEFQNNINNDSEFANVANIDFSLNSTSPCIDVGAWLTTCNGGNTGTAVTVHDARYFCDGFGLITGDEITVGTDDVTITNVNYGTNVLTVTPSFTWVDADNVSLRYNGSAPDIGAIESASLLTAEGYPDGYFYFEIEAPHQYCLAVAYDEVWHYYQMS